MQISKAVNSYSEEFFKRVNLSAGRSRLRSHFSADNQDIFSTNNIVLRTSSYTYELSSINFDNHENTKIQFGRMTNAAGTEIHRPVVLAIVDDHWSRGRTFKTRFIKKNYNKILFTSEAMLLQHNFLDKWKQFLEKSIIGRKVATRKFVQDYIAILNEFMEEHIVFLSTDTDLSVIPVTLNSNLKLIV